MIVRFLFTLILCAGTLVADSFKRSPYDLTLVGQVAHADGLARLPIGLTDILKDDLSINHIATPGYYVFTDVPRAVKNIIQNPDKTPGNVALLFDILWAWEVVPSDWVPQQSLIKIAYSMLEGTEIPAHWVTILNTQFDAVVVPDSYYQSVYTNSGVHIPIFVLPHGVDLERLLAVKPALSNKNHFVFGTSAAFWPRKNYDVLLEAFAQEFGNDPQVELHLHGRTGSRTYRKVLQGIIKKNNLRNVFFTQLKLPQREYEEFLASLDCYVLVSKGEGFSVTPREALARGIPCILSNNTAHQTLCDTGYVIPVVSTIAEPAYYSHLGTWGYQYNCTVLDVRKALREVYEHYDRYHEKALEARTWVEQYTWSHLRNKFLSLIKPKKVILGSVNRVTDDSIMTTSQELYKKYEMLISSS